MKKRLILHIGSPKTGTTAIQGLLNTQQGVLRDNGVNYLRAGRKHISHNGVVAEFRSGEAAAFCKEVASEVEASDCRLHIISSELFFFRPGVAQMVASGLAEHLPAELRAETTVVCYLRRHDRYLEAIYKQLVKNGKIAPSPSDFIRSHIGLTAYSKQLDVYATAFGQQNVVVRPFERQAFPGGDVARDFAQQAGFPDGVIPDLHSDGTQNRTLSVELSEMLGSLAKHSSINTKQVIRNIIKLGHDGAFRSNDVYDLTTRQRIVEDLNDDDVALNRLYGTGRKTFFNRDDLAGNEESVQTIQDHRDRWHEASRVMAMALAKQLP